MSPEEAVRERGVALNTSAGSRIYMLKLPQKPTLPAGRVQLVSNPADYHLRGGGRYGVARVQVDSFAAEASGIDPYAQASQLADELNGDDDGSGLSGWVGDIGSPAFTVLGCFRVARRATYEPGEGTGAMSGTDLRQVRIQQDYMVHYKMP